LLVEQQQKMAELATEAGPIVKEMTRAASGNLADLESRGYFAFAKEVGKLADRVVTSYEPDDVAELTGSVVAILDTVRNLTQPEILAVVNEASGAINDAQTAEPLGMLGVVRATREDDVQRGLAVAIEVLRHVGRAADLYIRRHATPQEKVAVRLAPRLAPRRRAVDPAPKVPSASAPAAPAAPLPPELAGVDLDRDGFLVDAAQWTESIAVAIAGTLGVAALTDEHWRVIRFVRDEYARSEVSPNIRKITKGADVSTKALYGLFPKAPGKAVAKIAGVPKPAGCI